MNIKLVIAIAQDVQAQLFAQDVKVQIQHKEIHHQHVFASLRHGIM